VDAARRLIADTGNDGLRIVNQAVGTISTLAGVLAAQAPAPYPLRQRVLLNAPRGVAVNSREPSRSPIR